MEIYSDLSNEASKEFEKLLNTHHSKTPIEEGKIIEGIVNKITEKYVFLYIENLKSEPVIDIQEAKSILGENLKEGSKIQVLLETLENKSGEVVVSASKAKKIKGWDKLVEAYEKKEPIMGRILSTCKGGAICEHIDTGSLMFLPGSQISDKPLKNINHLINEPQKFAIIKLDRQRGNCCVSRREIISSFKKEDKAKIIDRFKEGDIIKGADCKGFSSFGAFFSVNGELDVLVHLQELSYSRVDHPDQILEIGQKSDLKVISVDKEKLQVGCSIKQLSPDPFEKIDQFELNKTYDFKIIKLMEFGAFAELVDLPGLSTLLHSSECSWLKKNVSVKKMFKTGQIIKCQITEIDKIKRRVAISHKLVTENPFKIFENKHKIGSKVNGEIVNKNEYSLFVKIENFDIDAFLHCNDLTYLDNGEEELKKFNKGDKITVKVLEINIDDQKIRVGFKQTMPDPLDWFKDKKVNDIITVKIISSQTKGLIVRPENCEMDFLIKKNQIAINPADQRSSRFTGGERVDCAIQELNGRKVSLSIKLLEELQKKEALEKFGTSEGSGKSLPFVNLADELKKKKDNKE